MSCKHERYTLNHKMQYAKVPGLDVQQMILKVSAKCSECGRPFTFRATCGFSTVEPTVSAESEEIRVPVDWPEFDEDEPEKKSEEYVH